MGWVPLRWLLLTTSKMAASWIAASDFCYLWTSQKYFADFEQVIKTGNKTPVRETGCLYIFFNCYLMSPTLHPGFSDLWRSPPAFFECLGIQFFNSLTCDLRDAMPRQMSPTLICSHVTCGTLCHARGHLHSYLGKRRISLGVIGILSIYLRSHT